MYDIFFSSPHSRPSCLCVGPSLIIKAVRVVWPINSPTAAIRFCLLISWSSFVQLDRSSLIRVLVWPQTLLVFHLFRCSCLKWLLMTSSLTTKGISTVWWRDSMPLRWSMPFYQCIHFLYSTMSGTHTEVNSLNFPSACILSLARADSVVVFADAAIAALLSGQICFLLLVTFSGKSSSVHLRTAITSTGNTVERLPIGLLSLWLPLCPWTPAPKRLQISDPSVYEMAT